MKNFLCIIFILTAFSAFSKTATISDNEFSNPVLLKEQGPDPFVYRHTDGYYYGMHTVMDSNGYTPKVVLYKNKTLSDLFVNGEEKYVYELSKNQSKWNSGDVWAPEIYNFDGVWYIYYSVNFKIGILSNKSENPMEGEWKDEGRILKNEAWAIDASIFKQNGKMYMLWSGIPKEGMQRIYIQEMSSPTTVTGRKLELSKPDLEWEYKYKDKEYTTNEGPIALQRNGKTFVIYSGNCCISEAYALGMLTIDEKADPMVKENWIKSKEPVFKSSKENKMWGPGHNGFTVSPDNSEDWIIYHVLMNDNFGGKRYLAMQKFTWNEDGTPNFGVPQGRIEGIKKPSGE